MKAHPRSRGENPRRAPLNSASCGSSPLTRGKHRRRCPDAAARRLIPAHAGKTGAGRWTAYHCRAHPRSRGENLIGAVRTFVVTGSSPLTRGKPYRRWGRTWRRRLIPAHAGKTWRPPDAGAPSTAHPRSRGENRVAVYEVTQTGGSSPLTRGKPGLNPVDQPGRRLIPAHAGKTLIGQTAFQSPWAHPRSRGENRSRGWQAYSRDGSSPLTRGKLTSASTASSPGRLIPAHAGKTNLAKHLDGLCWAHPRSRGENQLSATPTVKGEGSSPLTRGKL